VYQARAREGAVKNGISTSPRTALGKLNLVPSAMLVLPSGPGTIGRSATSTTKTSASTIARANAGRSDGCVDARISNRSISFSGSNMEGSQQFGG
jgi:hypothetical protein